MQAVFRGKRKVDESAFIARLVQQHKTVGIGRTLERAVDDVAVLVDALPPSLFVKKCKR